jgi:hypothetical protein
MLIVAPVFVPATVSVAEYCVFFSAFVTGVRLNASGIESELSTTTGTLVDV